MHASIALCVMMLGGPIYPEAEITTVPLKDDLANLTSIQNLEWQEAVKGRTLPPVPTMVNPRQSADDNRPGPYRYPPTSQQPRQPMMPSAPTDATGGGGGGYSPGRYGQGGGYAAPAAPYATGSIPGRYPVNTFNNSGGQYNAPVPPVAPRASDYSGQLSVTAIASQYGLGNNAAPIMSAGGGAKPFSDYQRPNGYSPWNLLNQSTNNGTLSPYTAYVRPAMDQQMFNSHISEQINNVRTQQPYYSGTPGVETNLGGNGLLNPNSVQVYTTH